jgi:uncharacterized membrane protein
MVVMTMMMMAMIMMMMMMMMITIMIHTFVRSALPPAKSSSQNASVPADLRAHMVNTNICSVLV